MTLQDDITNLKDATRRLSDLLETPELGVMSWYEAVRSVIEEMNEITGPR